MFPRNKRINFREVNEFASYFEKISDTNFLLNEMGYTVHGYFSKLLESVKSM